MLMPRPVLSKLLFDVSSGFSLIIRANSIALNDYSIHQPIMPHGMTSFHPLRTLLSCWTPPTLGLLGDGGYDMHKMMLACGFAAVAVSATAQTPDQKPTIIVDGYGEVKTMPDVATISYTLRGEGTTSDAAVKAMVAMGVRIEGSLRSIDPAAEQRTNKVEVSAIRKPDCKERDYGPEQLSTGECAIVGYIATQNVTVKTTKVTEAGTLVGLAARDGSFDAGVTGFDLQDPRTARQQAIADAIQDAASKAAAVAAGSRLALGPIVTVSTSGRAQGQEIVVTGTRLPQSNLSSPAPPPVNVKLTPEPIVTSANVTVTYAIAR